MNTQKVSLVPVYRFTAIVFIFILDDHFCGGVEVIMFEKKFYFRCRYSKIELVKSEQMKKIAHFF